jgi:hypothetical protein
VTSIGEEAFAHGSEELVIHGHSKSYAETYARDNGIKFVSLDATTHSHTMQAMPAKAATATTDGNIAYWYCSGCQKYFSDAEGKTEITLAQAIVQKTENSSSGNADGKTDDKKQDTLTQSPGEQQDTASQPTQSASNTQNPISPASVPAAKGTTVNDEKSGAAYKVSSTDSENPTVTYTGTTDKKAKTVSIPATVTVDGVTYQVTAIADNAFSGCTKLKTVTIGKNVTSIGTNAFKGCSALTKLTIPANVTKIGANAFSGCKKLKTLTVKTTKLTKKSIAKNAFKGLTKATKIKVPKSKLSAYKKLFKSKGLSAKVKVTK